MHVLLQYIYYSLSITHTFSKDEFLQEVSTEMNNWFKQLSDEILIPVDKKIMRESEVCYLTAEIALYYDPTFLHSLFG